MIKTVNSPVSTTSWHLESGNYDPVQEFINDPYGVSTYRCIIEWCSINCSKQWRHFSFNTWEFESANDAVLFRLTWG